MRTGVPARRRHRKHFECLASSMDHSDAHDTDISREVLSGQYPKVATGVGPSFPPFDLLTSLGKRGLRQPRAKIQR
jgi:hypothetical protein